MSTPAGKVLQSPEVFIAGQVCIDRNDIEGVLYTGWGSPALYIASYFRGNLGVDPTVFASHGQDFAEYTEGFSIIPPEPVEARTLVYENIVVDGIRTQFCRNADNETLPDIDAGAQEAAAQAELFLFAPLTPVYDADYVAKLVSYLPEDCLKVILPQGYMRTIDAEGLIVPRGFEEEADIVDDFDLLIVSDEDLPDALAEAQEWKQRHGSTEIVVTQNSNGAYIVEKDDLVCVSTEPIEEEKIVDTVGSGDTFSAATAYSFLRGPKDLRTAVKIGNQAARQKLLASRLG